MTIAEDTMRCKLLNDCEIINQAMSLTYWVVEAVIRLDLKIEEKH